MIFFLVFLLVFTLTIMAGESKPQEKEAALCPPHKWVVRESDNATMCWECGYVAGTYRSDKGEY